MAIHIKKYKSFREDAGKSGGSNFVKLFKIAAVATLNKEEYMKYEKDMMDAWDEYAIKKSLLEEGREEGKAKVVKNLILKMGMSDKQISDIAEVSSDFVKKIREKLQKK